MAQVPTRKTKLQTCPDGQMRLKVRHVGYKLLNKKLAFQIDFYYIAKQFNKMADYIFIFFIVGIILIALFNIRFVTRLSRSIGLFIMSIGRLFHHKKHHT